MNGGIGHRGVVLGIVNTGMELLGDWYLWYGILWRSSLRLTSSSSSWKLSRKNRSMDRNELLLDADGAQLVFKVRDLGIREEDRGTERTGFSWYD